MISDYNNTFCCYDSCHILIICELSFGATIKILTVANFFWDKPPLYNQFLPACLPGYLGVTASWEPFHFLRDYLYSKAPFWQQLVKKMLQSPLLVPGCGSDAAEKKKATLHYSFIRQESHLRAIYLGYCCSMLPEWHRTSIKQHLGHRVGEIVLLYPILCH